MDIKTFAAVFVTVFLAELGDKTQLATILFSTDRSISLVGVFLAASFALIASTAIAVVAGSAISNYVEPRLLSVAAGFGFVLIGVWTIWSAA